VRRFLTVSFLLVAATAIASQVPPRPKPEMWVIIRQADSLQGSAGVGVQHTEMYVGGGWGGAVARPIVAGSPLAVSSFRIRAWKEGDKARVVVYAVVSDTRAPKGETETPISTFALALGQSHEVTETEPWGAKHVVVNAATELSAP
jgi:hypothetical protein